MMFIEVFRCSRYSNAKEKIVLNTNTITEIRPLNENKTMIQMVNNDHYIIDMNFDVFIKKLGAVKL